MAENIQLPPTPAPEDMPVNRNIGDGLCVMTWVLLGVSTVLVGGRMMSKTLVLRRFRWDDVFLLLTWATSIGYSVLIQLAYHHGFGRHSLYLEIPHALKLLKYAYICQMFCVLTPMFGRIAVTLYTLSLLGRTKAYLRYFLWSLLWLQVIFNIAIAITLLSACGTDMTIIANPATTCYRQSPWSRFAQFIGAFNAFTDGALSLAPGFVISGLRTTTRAKLAACCLLCLSSLASVAAIWRTIEIDKIFDADWDFTFNAVPYFYASSFEQSIIMITASIPTLGPIARHIRHKTSTTFSASKHGSVVLSNSTASTSRHDSASETSELQKNLSHALGIHLPGLGNTVVITGGAAKKGRKNSRDSVLPLSDIKATTRTDVKVETAPAYSTASGEEDVESLFNMPKTMSREGK